jgi:putative aldouronate transport system permease protein
MGWSTIIYVAALAGVSHELHEAAELDGASRWKRVLNVDLPAILPTVCIMLILRFGSAMSVGYEKVYLMQNDLNLSTSEVISTYVYKVGFTKANQQSFGTAVDLFNAVINTIMLVSVNAITNKLTNGEQGLF